MPKFDFEKPRNMKVARIENDGDRLRLFSNADPKPFEYYIIAPSDVKINIGDEIVYEPYGINFGWFERLSSDNSFSQE